MQVQLTDRQQHILWATVRHYIATAEPVGSKALVDEYKLGMSSATIRSIMGVLEESGLLYQPHTSSGRVPSDSGYRIYVDRLIKPSATLIKKAGKLLQESFAQKYQALESLLLQRAATILATLSGCISLITIPQSSTDTLRHLQLVQVGAGRVMLIVVTDDYETNSVQVKVPITLEAEDDLEIINELQIVSNFLNNQLRGQNLTALSTLDWSQLDEEFQRYL